MRLVIFTAHYPYGSGEVFLENELRVAENKFDEIVIVSNAKASENISRYLPTNARVVLLRKDQNTILQNLCMLRALFLPKYWREFFVGYKERGWRCICDILLKLLRTERGFIALKKTESKWMGSEKLLRETVFYSYWFEPTVLYLKSRHIDTYRVFISRAHGGDCFFDRGYVPWRRDSLDTLNAIFPISEIGREDILAHYEKVVPRLKDKLYVAHLGVEIPTRIGPVPDDKGPVLLVTCSNVIRLKRLDLLIDALKQWEDRPLQWLHFGDGALMEEIRMLAQEKLSGNPLISWEFRGRVTNKKILDFYCNTPVTLFVNCSDVEGIPVAAMEAMSFGIPVVARAVGGNAELVNDYCGALLPSNASVDLLIRAMQKLTSKQSHKAYMQMRQEARNRVEKYYAATINYELFWEKVKEL